MTPKAIIKALQKHSSKEAVESWFNKSTDQAVRVRLIDAQGTIIGMVSGVHHNENDGHIDIYVERRSDDDADTD